MISRLGLTLAGLAGLDTGLTGLALVGLGPLLGMAFMGFQYGFALAGADFETGDASSLSLHFLLSAVCALMFIPVSAAGLGPLGSLMPVSVSLLLAPLYSTGMQLVNGCGSGVVQLWWRIWPDDRGFAILCHWFGSRIDNSCLYWHGGR